MAISPRHTRKHSFRRASTLTSPIRQELRLLTRLAVPIVTVQVGMMAMGMADVAMIGRVSTEALAAVALGQLMFFGLLIIGMGILQAVDPLISQAVGAKDHRSIGTDLQRGAIIAVLLAVPISLCALPAGWLLEVFGQPPAIIPVAESYIHASIPGVLPFLLFVLLRQTLQAFSRTGPLVWTIIVTNAVNVLLNWLLIFGNLGFPEMGAVGCAWATTICRFLLVFMLMALGWRQIRPHISPLRRQALELQPLMRMAALGLPIGLAFALEYGAFMATALLMGQLGTRELAGHQIAISLASFSFMFPVGLGAAATVRVGYAVGRRDSAGARRAAGIALAGGVAVMTVFATVFLAWPDAVARMCSDQPEALAMAVVLLPLAGVFQVFDGLQAVASGVLRGAGDTRTPMFVHLLGFWALGIPVGWYLSRRTELGPEGLWWGLVLGLAVAATILVLRVRARLGETVERVRIN